MCDSTVHFWLSTQNKPAHKKISYRQTSGAAVWTARILVGLIRIRMMMAAVVATIMIMMMIMMIPTIVTARAPSLSSVIQIIGRIVDFFVCHDGRHRGREGGGGRTRCGGGEGGGGGWVRSSLVVGRCSGRGRGGSMPEYGVVVFSECKSGRADCRPTQLPPSPKAVTRGQEQEAQYNN